MSLFTSFHLEYSFVITVILVIFTAFVFKLHISFISNQTSTVTKYLPSSEIYSFLSVLVII